MRLPFAAIAAVGLAGLLAGCQRDNTHRIAEASRPKEMEGITTRKAPVRPWTSAKAWKTAKAPTPVDLAPLEQVLKLANEPRLKANLPPLKLSPTLIRVAQEYAVLLAKEKNINAVPEKKNVADRAREAGYAFVNLSSHINALREPATPEVVGRMMKEPAAAAVLGMAMYTDMGLGIAPANDGNTYIVLLFAAETKK